MAIKSTLFNLLSWSVVECSANGVHIFDNMTTNVLAHRTYKPWLHYVLIYEEGEIGKHDCYRSTINDQSCSSAVLGGSGHSERLKQQCQIAGPNYFKHAFKLFARWINYNLCIWWTQFSWNKLFFLQNYMTLYDYALSSENNDHIRTVLVAYRPLHQIQTISIHFLHGQMSTRNTKSNNQRQLSSKCSPQNEHWTNCWKYNAI